VTATTVPLGELVDVVAGGTPKRSNPRYFGGEIPWVKIGDLLQGTVVNTEESISELGLKSCSAKLLPAGTLLLSIFATIGRTAVLGVDAATNQAIVGLKITSPSRVDRDFLRRYLDYSSVNLAEKGRGVAQANINLSILRSHPVPVPPIEEQRRIASILDAADALRAKRRQTLEKLNALARSIFIDKFGPRLIPPVDPRGRTDVHEKGWTRQKLIEVAEIATGHTPDRKVSEYWNGNISWVNLNEIRDHDGRVCFGTEARITEPGINNSSAVVLPQGTVCFSRTASIGFVTIMGIPMSTSQDFVNWICSDQLNPRYLMDAFVLSRQVLRGSSDGSTHKTIYMRDAERFTVLVPPKSIQDEYARLVEVIDSYRSKLETQSASLDTLFSSLQYRAFRGEL
jgi:type I restriction enzyme S subunit